MSKNIKFEIRPFLSRAQYGCLPEYEGLGSVVAHSSVSRSWDIYHWKYGYGISEDQNVPSPCHLSNKSQYLSQNRCINFLFDVGLYTNKIILFTYGNRGELKQIPSESTYGKHLVPMY